MPTVPRGNTNAPVIALAERAADLIKGVTPMKAGAERRRRRAAPRLAVSRDDFYASPLGAAYSAYMERPRLSRAIGRLIWGGDTGAYYESMAAVGEVPGGGTIVDCPCGAGPALRALRPDAGVRYVAADLSPAMLRRARERAGKRGLDGIEFVESRAEDLPLEAASADLFLSLLGHALLPRPARRRWPRSGAS